MPKRPLPSGDAELIPRWKRYKRHGEDRRDGNPHDAGYSEWRVSTDPVKKDWSVSVTRDGRPSLYRCIWRGMLNVSGLLGSADQDELRSHELCDVLYRYTSQGPKSIYKHVNNTLAHQLEGAQPRKRSGLYYYTEKLVMAVRLLWTPDISRVYRGVSSDVEVDVLQGYQRTDYEGEYVQWNAFTSTSLSRDVALDFARDGGVLFTINRNVNHAAAADISEYSQFPDEQEVLLLPMLRFEVDEVLEPHETGESYTEIVLNEVADYPGEL